MRIYLDLLMLLNFLVDLLLLMGTNRMAGFPVEWKRTLCAAALGSLYSGACMVPGFRFLGSLLWRTVSLAGMAGIAFGWNRSAWKRCAIFVMLSMAMGGMATCFGKGDIPAMIPAALGVWLLCRVAFADGIGERRYVPVTIACGDHVVRLTALVDSGNTLRDPITGEKVLVIGAEAAETLTGLSQKQLASPLETVASVRDLRLIPFRAVGQVGGMLLAKRFQNVIIGSRRQSAIVAFAPEGLGQGQMYQALTGGA